VTGGARNVTAAMPDGSNVVMARSFLNMPANFTQGGGDSGFSQDYQVELYYENKDPMTGKVSGVTHFYAVWRDFHIGTLNSSYDLYINLILGELQDFDTRSGLVCKNMNPQPAFQ
jgi:hypothetical protein